MCNRKEKFYDRDRSIYEIDCSLPDLPGEFFCWQHAPEGYAFSKEQLEILQEWIDADEACGAPTGSPSQEWIDSKTQKYK